MRSITGNLSLMSVMDIFQWAEVNKRSGTLTLKQDDNQKKFYLQDGQIIFVWSDSEGERIADFLQFEAVVSQDKLSEALADSEMLGLPFVGYLYSEKIITKPKLEEVLLHVVKAALLSAFTWETGMFEFTDELPVFVQNGPVRLRSTQLLMESVQIFDESGHKNRQIDSNRIIAEIVQQIEEGNVDLPPIPDIMQRIAAKIDNPDIPIDEIVNCITDQILASKILKIGNSPYYRRTSKITTLRDAILFIGFKSLVSIVTVHSLSSFSPRNTAKIRQILQHCLTCGIVAREISIKMGGDHEQAFICGLLHDVGKTLMEEMLSDYMLSDEIHATLIADYHAEIGYLLAKKWNFDESLQSCIRFHHTPDRAGAHLNIVELIYLSNIIATGNCHVNDLTKAGLKAIDPKKVNISELIEQVDSFNESAQGIINT